MAFGSADRICLTPHGGGPIGGEGGGVLDELAPGVDRGQRQLELLLFRLGSARPLSSAGETPLLPRAASAGQGTPHRGAPARAADSAEDTGRADTSAPPADVECPAADAAAVLPELGLARLLDFVA